MSDNDHFTLLLGAALGGDLVAQQRFFELVNDELRHAARRIVRNPNEDRPSSLVNELYIKLFKGHRELPLVNRRYFYAVAIDQMRQIARERHRKRKSLKQGGHLNQSPLDVVLDSYLDDFESRNRVDFLSLMEALDRLQEDNDRQCEVVKLYYFLGYEQAEIAELFDVSVRTVARDLKLGLAKLNADLREA